MKQSHVTGLPFQHHHIGEISIAIVSRVLVRFLYISGNSKKLGEKNTNYFFAIPGAFRENASA